MDDRKIQKCKTDTEVKTTLVDKSHWLADFLHIQRNFFKEIIKVTPPAIILEWQPTHFDLNEQ